jgi:hypothetical protein
LAALPSLQSQAALEKNSQMKFNMMASATALTFVLASGAAFADDLTGVSAVDDRLADIETAVSDHLARGEDASRFGNPETAPV